LRSAAEALTPDQIKAILSERAFVERERRELATQSLVAYAKSIEIPGAPVGDNPDAWVFEPIESRVAKHHLLMLEAMERTMLRPYGRLILMLPPGSAKSTYGSIVAPTWFMGKFPGSRILLASYGDTLAARHGRRARQVVKSQDYSAIFQTSINPESRAADQWALMNGSEYLAGGILSGITGNRANGWIIDDPVKNRQDADSQLIRDRTFEEYEQTVKTRALPGCWGILIQTRWHEDDLAGRILPRDWDGESGMIRGSDGLDWEVICLPALCDRPNDPLGRKLGEYIWPEYYPREHWRQFQQDARGWGSLYQQRPTVEEGTYFKRDWFQRYDSAPGLMNIYMTADFALSEDGGDFTELAVWGVAPDRKIYALAWWFGQTDSYEWAKQIIAMVQQWQPLFLIAEGDNIRKAVLPFLRVMMRETGVFVAVEEIPSGGGDKPAKARNFQAMQSAGMVLWPKTEWATRVIDQCLKFPAGKHDDAVDACSVLGRFLAKTWAAVAPPPPPKPIEQVLAEPVSVASLGGGIVREDGSFQFQQKRARW